MNIKDLNLPSPHVYAISDSEVYLLDDYTVDTIIGRITVKRGFIFDGALDIHTGEVQKNAMHYICRDTTDREFDDIITDSDQLDMEIKDEKLSDSV